MSSQRGECAYCESPLFDRFSAGRDIENYIKVRGVGLVCLKCFSEKFDDRDLKGGEMSDDRTTNT